MNMNRLVPLAQDRQDLLVAYLLARNSLNQDLGPDAIESSIRNPQMMQPTLLGPIAILLRRYVLSEHSYTQWRWVLLVLLVLNGKSICARIYARSPMRVDHSRGDKF
jgi:hypothetical protein